MSGIVETLAPLVNLGSLGILCIEASYLPQIARLYRRKHADDVSVFFPSLNLFGRALAVVYSLTQHQAVFVIGFTLGIVLRSILLSQVVYYRWQRKSLRRSVPAPAIGEALGDSMRRVNPRLSAQGVS
jgi:lipid-A-disaccharide synthase-like uncharacterized protein